MSDEDSAYFDQYGQVPSDWYVLPLREVTDFQEGPGILAKDFHEAGVPLIRLRNITSPVVQLGGCNYLNPETVEKKWSHFRLRCGDFLISTSASLGRVSEVDSVSAGSIAYTGIIRFRTNNERLYHPYLRAYLSSNVFVRQAERMATGSVIKHFGPSHLRKMAITIPTLPEQREIAETFDSFDKRITLLRETNKTLEAIAQAIFKSWFVDFDPVKAKMDGRQPTGMDEETAALFPDELVESELGLIPKGWEVKPVGDVVTTVGGGTPDTKNTDYWMPAMHSWTSPKDLAGISSPVLVSTARSISDKGLARISSGLLPKGTLLLSSRAPIGYLAIADLPVAINQGYIAMTPASGSLSPVYMLHWCKANMEVIKGQANGSTFMEISKTTFRRLPIILPPKRIADSFSALAQQLFTRITLNVRQADHLADLRDTLLPRLISGKLRVPIDEAETSKA